MDKETAYKTQREQEEERYETSRDIVYTALFLVFIALCFMPK